MFPTGNLVYITTGAENDYQEACGYYKYYRHKVDSSGKHLPRWIIPPHQMTFKTAFPRGTTLPHIRINPELAVADTPVIHKYSQDVVRNAYVSVSPAVLELLDGVKRIDFSGDVLKTRW